VEFLSIFRISSTPAQTQISPTEAIFRISSPPAQTKIYPIEATVLSLLFIHVLSTRSPILPKWNKNLNTYVRSGMASPKF